MSLSNKANHYLTMLNYEKDYRIQSREEIINYLTSQNIPPLKKVIDFAVNYSGMILSVYMKEGSTFIAGLFTRRQIETNEKIDCIRLNGKYYFYCGEEAIAQFLFVLSENGEFCTYDNFNGFINILASSFEKVIENYAMENSIILDNYYEHRPYYELKNPVALDHYTSQYSIDQASDEPYSKWFLNDEFVVRRGVWLDRAAYYVHLYGRNEQKCKELIELLKEENII